MIIGDKNDAWCYLKNDLDLCDLRTKSEANVVGLMAQAGLVMIC